MYIEDPENSWVYEDGEDYEGLETLENLMYIRREWYYLAKSVYLKKITWQTKKKFQWLKQHLKAANKNHKDKHIFQQLPMTKKLVISDLKCKSDRTQFTAKEFLYLLSRFPNLKQLDIEQSKHRELYKETLRSCQPTDLPQFLEEIAMDGEYDIVEQGHYQTQKFETFYQFRKSLKHMTQAYCNSFVHGKSFLELLADFESLTTLEIYNDMRPDLTLFHLLQNCPSLSSLTYSSSFSITQDATQQPNTMILKLDGQKSSISQPFNNLKKLNLNVPTLTTHYIDFFTNHCPKNLNEVEIHLTHTGMHQWIDNVTMGVALDFCAKLQRISTKTLEFGGEPVRNHEDVDIFYEILNALAGERDFKVCSVNHEDCEGSNHLGVKMQMIGSELFYQYCYNIKNFISTDGNYSRQSLYNKFDRLSPPSATSLKQLAKINTLYISNDCRGNEGFELSLKLYLEYIRRFCPGVRHFSISNSSGKDISADYFGHGQSFQNMKTIFIDGIGHPSAIMDDLLEFFPRLEVLNFNVFRSKSRTSRNKRATFNLSNFKFLNTLVLQSKLFDVSKSCPVFIKYVDKQQKWTLYQVEFTAEDDIVSENNFKPVSSNTIQEVVKRGTCSYLIRIVGSHQLKRIDRKSVV